MEEIRTIPHCLTCYDNDQKIDDEFYDLDDEDDLIPLDSNCTFLKDKREYDKLKELKYTVKHYSKIVESYGYDPYTGDYDTKKFPITKEDKQMENIDKDLDNYNKAVEEYRNYMRLGHNSIN